MADNPIQPSPSTAESPPPAATDLAAQYELGDAPADPTPAATAPTTSTPEPTPPKERDPQTGRYVKPTHPRQLLAMARDLGMEDEAIQSLSTDDLATEVRIAQRELKAYRQQTQQLWDLGRFSQPAQPTQTQAAPESTGANNPGLESGGGLAELSDEYDPTLRGIINALVREVKQLKALAPRLSQIEQREQNRESMSATQRMDACFTKHPDVYGSGSHAKIKSDASLMAKRKAVATIMSSLQGEIEERFEEAHKILYGNTPSIPKTPTTNGTLPTPEQWGEAALARATGRANDAQPPGVDKAVQTAAAWLKQNGEEVPVEVPQDEDGFLE